MLDMEGVLSAATEWAANGDEPLMSEQAASKLIQEEPATLLTSELKDLDVTAMAKDAGMSPQDVEEVLTGKVPTRISSKSLADSILFELPDEDREALEKINKL